MFSAYRHCAQAYRQVAHETSITSGRPIDLVLLLYQGTVDALNQALAAPVTRIAPKPGQAAAAAPAAHDRAARSSAIGRAIRILDEGLNASLDDAGGEITVQLRDLYAYMTQQLLSARLHDDHRPVEEVRRLLMELHVCWVEIAARPATAPAARTAHHKRNGSSVNP